jgi:hypothetical protein
MATSSKICVAATATHGSRLNSRAGRAARLRGRCLLAAPALGGARWDAPGHARVVGGPEVDLLEGGAHLVGIQAHRGEVLAAVPR